MDKQDSTRPNNEGQPTNIKTARLERLAAEAGKKFSSNELFYLADAFAQIAREKQAVINQEGDDS